MLVKRLKAILIVCFMMGLVGCGNGGDVAVLEPTETAMPEASGVIVVGDISDEPVKKIERFQPLVDYLAANLGEFGIGVGAVKVAPDIETMIEWMNAGEVDIFMDSPYPAMLVSDQTGAQPILRRWKNDVAEYHSVFFAKVDSGVDSIEALQGQIVAFEEPNSTSGYMLPLSYLIDAGLKPVEKSSPNAVVAADEVGYIFSGEDQNTLQWVVSGRVLVGATDNNNYEALLASSDIELSIVAETESVARNVVLVGPDMDAELVEAIKLLLTALDETPEGEEILVINRTGQFDEFPDGADTALTRMRMLYERTQ